MRGRSHRVCKVTTSFTRIRRERKEDDDKAGFYRSEGDTYAWPGSALGDVAIHTWTDVGVVTDSRGERYTDFEWALAVTCAGDTGAAAVSRPAPGSPRVGEQLPVVARARRDEGHRWSVKTKTTRAGTQVAQSPRSCADSGHATCARFAKCARIHPGCLQGEAS